MMYITNGTDGVMGYKWIQCWERNLMYVVDNSDLLLLYFVIRDPETCRRKSEPFVQETPDQCLSFSNLSHALRVCQILSFMDHVLIVALCYYML